MWDISSEYNITNPIFDIFVSALPIKLLQDAGGSSGDSTVGGMGCIVALLQNALSLSFLCNYANKAFALGQRVIQQSACRKNNKLIYLIVHSSN